MVRDERLEPPDPDAVPDPERPPVLHRDFHLDNVVLAPDDGADPLVRASSTSPASASATTASPSRSPRTRS